MAATDADPAITGTYYERNLLRCRANALNYYRAHRERYLEYYKQYYQARKALLPPKPPKPAKPPKPPTRPRGRPAKPRPVQETPVLPILTRDESPPPAALPTILIQMPPEGASFLVVFE